MGEGEGVHIDPLSFLWGRDGKEREGCKPQSTGTGRGNPQQMSAARKGNAACGGGPASSQRRGPDPPGGKRGSIPWSPEEKGPQALTLGEPPYEIAGSQRPQPIRPNHREGA